MMIILFSGSNQSSVELLTNLTSSCEPSAKVPRLVESQTNNNNNNSSSISFDAPKRTRFTFRPEHLDVKKNQSNERNIFLFCFLDS